jgi:hypothetical protein
VATVIKGSTDGRAGEAAEPQPLLATAAHKDAVSFDIIDRPDAFRAMQADWDALYERAHGVGLKYDFRVGASPTRISGSTAVRRWRSTRARSRVWLG